MSSVEIRKVRRPGSIMSASTLARLTLNTSVLRSLILCTAWRFGPRTKMSKPWPRSTRHRRITKGQSVAALRMMARPVTIGRSPACSGVLHLLLTVWLPDEESVPQRLRDAVRRIGADDQCYASLALYTRSPVKSFFALGRSVRKSRRGERWRGGDMTAFQHHFFSPRRWPR